MRSHVCKLLNQAPTYMSYPVNIARHGQRNAGCASYTNTSDILTSTCVRRHQARAPARLRLAHSVLVNNKQLRQCEFRDSCIWVDKRAITALQRSKGRHNHTPVEKKKTKKKTYAAETYRWNPAQLASRSESFKRGTKFWNVFYNRRNKWCEQIPPEWPKLDE